MLQLPRGRKQTSQKINQRLKAIQRNSKTKDNKNDIFLFQGFHKHWEHALYMHKDFGLTKEWYIKDSLLFTPACTSKRILPPRQTDQMATTHDTGFGCQKLVKFRLSGDFIFPPMATRAKFNKYDAGPVIETGLYALIMYLKNINKFTCGFTPLVISR